MFISSALAQTATQTVPVQPPAGQVYTNPAIVNPTITTPTGTRVNTARDLGDQLSYSLNNAFSGMADALPKLIAFAVILIVGWIVASLVAKALAAILRSVRFNDLADRSGFGEFVYNMGIETDASGFIALIAKWFIRLIALVVAFDALGLSAVSEVLKQLLFWLPNAIVAIVVLVVGGLAATGLGNLVRGATAQAGMENSGTLAKVAQVIVWGFAIVVALTQLGIATQLVNTLALGLVGAVALAAGLAFGLGGQEAAAGAIKSWSEGIKNAAPKLAEVAQNAGDKLSRDADDAKSKAKSEYDQVKADQNKPRDVKPAGSSV